MNDGERDARVADRWWIKGFCPYLTMAWDGRDINDRASIVRGAGESVAEQLGHRSKRSQFQFQNKDDTVFEDAMAQ